MTWRLDHKHRWRKLMDAGWRFDEPLPEMIEAAEKATGDRIIGIMIQRDGTAWNFMTSDNGNAEEVHTALLEDCERYVAAIQAYERKQNG